jgi:hypothetical protein
MRPYLITAKINAAFQHEKVPYPCPKLTLPVMAEQNMNERKERGLQWCSTLQCSAVTKSTSGMDESGRCLNYHTKNSVLSRGKLFQSSICGVGGGIIDYSAPPRHT